MRTAGALALLLLVPWLRAAMRRALRRGTPRGQELGRAMRDAFFKNQSRSSCPVE